MNAEHQIRTLQIELAKAKTEATQLRKKVGENSRRTKLIHRAYEDAILMVSWLSVGIKPSRRFAAPYGLTQRRWENALCLVRMARLIRGRSRWVLMDIGEMEKRLKQSRDRALADEQVFFLRHTRHRSR